jgi:cation:H+ antiporter
MTPFLQIAAIFALSFILVKAADNVVVSIRRIAKLSGTGETPLVAIILAFATSLPELFVGIASAFSGKPELSFGNLIGANIVNIGFVMALAGIFAGGIVVSSKEGLRKEVPFVLFAGLLPVVLLVDKKISRIDALFLLFVYFVYASGFFNKRFVEVGPVRKDEGFWYKLIRSIEIGSGKVQHEFLRFFLAVAVMLVAAHFLVSLSVTVAKMLNVPVFIIGLLLLSLGTTLPELVFAIESIRQKSVRLVVANTFGSTVVNSTFMVGVVAMIHPVQVLMRREYLLATIIFFFLVFLFWFFVRRKERLTRLESGVLFLIYIIFVLLEITGFKIIY